MSFSRFARKELLRGPLGYPLLLRFRMKPVGRLAIGRPESLKLWRFVSGLPVSPGARKALFRLLYVLPFGPADAAAPWRVARRYRAFFRELGTA
jgi:hypothetical protein